MANKDKERKLAIFRLWPWISKSVLADFDDRKKKIRILRLVAFQAQVMRKSIPSIPSDSAARTEELKEGWALKTTRKPYRFNEKQKSFLTSKFDIGQKTGHKMDPEVVSREMRRTKGTNGERLFTRSEFLTAQQVGSFFSRLAAKIHQEPVSQEVQEEGAVAARDEDNFATARDSVLSKFQLTHPIVCDQQDVCSMVKAGNLSKQKLERLKFFCSELGVNAPDPPFRKKAPYLALLEALVRNMCTCMDFASIH